MNDPAFRAVSFDQIAEGYAEAVRGLVEGGVDLLLLETIFDTLNAKAALSAINGVFDARGERLPVMISGTITDLSGRTLSGQTPAAFWYSLRHAKPLTIGLNCALGAREIVVVNRDRKRAKGVATDLRYGAALSPAVDPQLPFIAFSTLALATMVLGNLLALPQRRHALAQLFQRQQVLLIGSEHPLDALTHPDGCGKSARPVP